MQGWERAIYTLSVKIAQPHNTNMFKERREGKRVEENERVQLRPIKKYWLDP